MTTGPYESTTVAANEATARSVNVRCGRSALGAGGVSTAEQADLLVLEDMNRLVAVVEHDLGGVDLLVNNGAFIGDAVFESFWDMNLSSWSTMLALNVNVPAQTLGAARLPRLVDVSPRRSRRTGSRAPAQRRPRFREDRRARDEFPGRRWARVSDRTRRRRYASSPARAGVSAFIHQMRSSIMSSSFDTCDVTDCDLPS